MCYYLVVNFTITEYKTLNGKITYGLEKICKEAVPEVLSRNLPEQPKKTRKNLQ
jgi:hypothetical protein